MLCCILAKVTVIHLCPNWGMGMIFWQINSYSMIALQGCLTGLNPLRTVEESINKWSKRERSFPSSFLMPSITADTVKEKPMHKTKLSYGACLQNLIGKSSESPQNPFEPRKKFNLKKKNKNKVTGAKVSATLRHEGLHNFLVSFSVF